MQHKIFTYLKIQLQNLLTLPYSRQNFSFNQILPLLSTYKYHCFVNLKVASCIIFIVKVGLLLQKIAIHNDERQINDSFSRLD